MEYYRTALIHWIDLYFESADAFHESFGDALNYFSEKFGRVPKTILQAIATLLESEGFSVASPQSKEHCRQKLQDVIFELVIQFERAFVDSGNNPTKCSRVRNAIRLPEPSERDAVLRSLTVAFNAVADRRKECKIDQFVEREPYRARLGLIEVIPQEGKQKKALEKIAGAIEKAKKDPEQITCRSCASMGDAVIAASLGKDWRLHSMDFVHGPISTALELEHTIHPSIAQLLGSTSPEPAKD
jgi:hypothetical protein